MARNCGTTYLHTERRLEKRTHAKAHDVERRVIITVGAEQVDCTDQVIGKEEVKAFTGDTKALRGIHTCS